MPKHLGHLGSNREGKEGKRDHMGTLNAKIWQALRPVRLIADRVEETCLAAKHWTEASVQGTLVPLSASEARSIPGLPWKRQVLS